MEKTRFEVEVSTMETRNDVEFKVSNPSCSERNFAVDFDYHLTSYKVRREIIHSQGYDYDVLGCYALNLGEGS